MHIHRPLFAAAALTCTAIPAAAFEATKPSNIHVTQATLRVGDPDMPNDTVYDCGYSLSGSFVNHQADLDTMRVPASADEPAITYQNLVSPSYETAYVASHVDLLRPGRTHFTVVTVHYAPERVSQENEALADMKISASSCRVANGTTFDCRDVSTAGLDGAAIVTKTREMIKECEGLLGDAEKEILRRSPGEYKNASAIKEMKWPRSRTLLALRSPDI